MSTVYKPCDRCGRLISTSIEYLQACCSVCEQERRKSERRGKMKKRQWQHILNQLREVNDGLGPHNITWETSYHQGKTEVNLEFPGVHKVDLDGHKTEEPVEERKPVHVTKIAGVEELKDAIENAVQLGFIVKVEQKKAFNPSFYAINGPTPFEVRLYAPEENE